MAGEEMTGEEVAGAEGETEEVVLLPKANFSVAVHTLIAAAQASHGLGGGSNFYGPYKAYCTRRLSRLRHQADVGKGLSHGSNAKGAARHAFRPLSNPPDESNNFNEANQHVNHLLVALFQAERGWAHAMELKALGETKQKNQHTPKRHYFLRRLHKAVKHAKYLEQLASATADDRTSLESQLYFHWMNGNYSLETSDWRGACEEYGSALRLCQELATQEEHNLELRDFFVGRATQTIEPLVRYCQYELGKDAAGGGSQDELQQLLQQNSATSAQLRRKLDSLQNERLASEASEGSMSTLSFRGQNIFVDDNQVRVTLLKISKDLQQVPGSEFDEEKLLQLLTECDTASSIVSAQLKEYNSKKSGPAVNKKRLELDCLLGYIKYQQLKERMGRNERMINELRSETTNTTKRLEEICHLYDALLQDARAVVGLPGGPKSSTDDDTHQDEEDEFVLEANAHVLRIRALRCYYIGSLYASPSGLKKDPAKAVALLEQASLLAAQAVEEIAACENMEGGDAYLTSMEDLEGDIRVAKCRAAASAYILSAGSGMMSSKSVSRSLLERLDDATIHDSDVLAHVPPKPEPIPCKPTFFDIALNHINTEPPVAQLQQHIADLEKGQGGSSLLGWFRRT